MAAFVVVIEQVFVRVMVVYALVEGREHAAAVVVNEALFLLLVYSGG